MNVFNWLSGSCSDGVWSMEEEDGKTGGGGGDGDAAGPESTNEAVMVRVTIASGGPSGLSDPPLFMGILGGCGSGLGTAMALAAILRLKRVVVESMETRTKRVMAKEKKVGRGNGDAEMAFSLLSLMLIAAWMVERRRNQKKKRKKEMKMRRIS